MRTYIVTIGPWSKEVEAENHNQARSIGVQVLTKEAEEIHGMDLKAKPLWDIAKIKLRIDHRKVALSFKKETQSIFPKEDREWVTGFWEGDSGIYYQGSPIISFPQKEPQILYYIKDTFNLVSEPKPGVEIWNLDISVKAGAYLILKVLMENVVSVSKTQQINKILNLMGQPNITSHKPTFPWLGGFWDAEGSPILSDNTLQLSISQKEVEVLEEIQDLVGFGRLHRWKSSGFTKNPQWYLEFGGYQARLLIPYILKYSKNEKKRSRLLSMVETLSSRARIWKGYHEQLNQYYSNPHNF